MRDFESIKDIKEASVEELLKVPELREKEALAVYEFFHKEEK
jgi:excinuclease ABC subunit C